VLRQLVINKKKKERIGTVDTEGARASHGRRETAGSIDQSSEDGAAARIT